MPEVLSLGDQGFGDELLRGALITVLLGLSALAVGLFLGLTLALGKMSRVPPVRWATEALTTFVRGIPELLTVFIIYFGLGALLLWLLPMVGYDGPVVIDTFVAGTIALGLVYGCFASEVLRGAYLAVPKGQIEAAQAAGMTDRQIFRRIRLPQMWRYALPGLGNLWMVLLKDTALVATIGLDELMRWSNVATETTRQPLTVYGAAAVLYLLMTIFSDLLRAQLERRAARGVRAA